MTRILAIGSLFSGAKDEYSFSSDLSCYESCADELYLVVLNAINQCLASQTRKRNVCWQYKTCLFYENSEKKKDRSRRSYSINLPILSEVKFSSILLG